MGDTKNETIRYRNMDSKYSSAKNSNKSGKPPHSDSESYMIGENQTQKEPSYVFMWFCIPIKMRIYTIFYWQFFFDIGLSLPLVLVPSVGVALLMRVRLSYLTLNQGLYWLPTMIFLVTYFLMFIWYLRACCIGKVKTTAQRRRFLRRIKVINVFRL